MAKINKEEYKILKGLDDYWEWIARDSAGLDSDKLYSYSEKPYKDHGTGVWSTDDNRAFLIDDQPFQFIQWEDEEPHNITELIKEYEFGKILLAMAEEETVLELDYESEEAEVKKNTEILKEEIEKEIRMWDGVEGGWSEEAIDKIFNLIDEFLLNEKDSDCDDK